MVQEKELKPLAGGVMVALLLILIPATAIYGFIWSAREGVPMGIVAASIAFMVDMVLLGGFTVVNPNEARVVLLFGVYLGSIKQPGFWWVNPFTRRRRVSLRVRNFESSKLKVNDQDGNPIEIASVIVWRVIETAEAVFHVDDYEHYVHVQSESAVRTLATAYPYDSHVEGSMSLRMSVVEIAHKLRDEIQERVGKAGVEVIEARITHLSYAPEIASVMLRRQQAQAIIAARQKIVEGAVGMVEMALDLLSAKHVVTLDEERKASMVSNLLVVLCSDRDAQPIVNTGTLYQ
jgi:regulator of protease activity HflC (stomatin/prohibitin superfamily)